MGLGLQLQDREEDRDVELLGSEEPDAPLPLTVTSRVSVPSLARTLYIPHLCLHSLLSQSQLHILLFFFSCSFFFLALSGSWLLV